MKTIGIIGGLGPASTVEYYQWLNEGVNKALGGNNAAQIIISSVNGENIGKFRRTNDPEGEGKFFATEAKRLEQAGADFILIASNTSHKNAPYAQKAVSIPLIHLADATVEHVLSQGVKDVGFLGTSTTIDGDFYLPKFKDADINIIKPDDDAKAFMDDVIYGDLTKGIVKYEANAEFINVIGRLKDAGAKAIILGCTELTLLDLDSVDLPIFDTVKIHVDKALKLALED